MTKLNALLAATDLSAPARHAVERAALISSQTGTPLNLVHVANLALLEKLRQLITENPEEMQQRVLDAAREKLHDLAAALLKRYGVSAGTRVASGSVLAALTEESDAMAADLIVCGARGEGFMRHLLLGATAERMLDRTKCPVLVVKQAVHESYRMLLVPVDFSPSSLRAIDHARAIAPQAEIVLLHVFDVPFEGHLRYAGIDDNTIKHYRVAAKQEAMQKLHALSAEAMLPPHATRFIVTMGNPSTCVVEQEQELDCDLIVMGKHGENTLEALFLGSVTKRVLAGSQCDVLVSV